MVWSMSAPSSFRLNSVAADSTFHAFRSHDSHPALGHLILLVFEAVLEVVCVSAPGYIVAVAGQFDANNQKFLANLNTNLFTPCLIFTKLASQLNAGKLADLAVIPVIFVIQTLVSYFVSIGVSKFFRFGKRPANFVTAMGVFGNSNSLPISLVLSLSSTIKGLHWDRIPGDNDDEVAARGILYLLIFQQLGQLVRWTWGYNVLLAPKESYDEYRDETIEEGRYRDEEPLIPGLEGSSAEGDTQRSDSDDGSVTYEPAGRTPVAPASRASPAESEDESPGPKKRLRMTSAHGFNGNDERFATPAGGPDDILSFPAVREREEPDVPEGWKGYWYRAKMRVERASESVKSRSAQLSRRTYESLPPVAQTILAKLWWGWLKVYNFLYEFMNPPLWAMLLAIVVASVPDLQRVFFTEGTFINNSVTSAVSQSAGVAVPLILVVLGANLARNTQPQDKKDPEEELIGTKLLVASVLSRMVIPFIIMAPIIALIAKYVPVSILDDPIFIIVCFLLVGAPSALQLAQICQLNEVYEGVMARILFWSYVPLILPSTLVLVMTALETVEWAQSPQ